MGRPPSSILAFVNRAARWDEEEATSGTGYHPRLFCQLALPYKDPGELAFWERRNGDFSLTVRPAVETASDGRRRVAYPFGSVPRLLLSWLATEAVRTRSPELVLGQNLTDFMHQIGMVPTGGKTGSITRLRRQINRLFDATITAEFHGDPHRDVGHNFTIAAFKDLWWSDKDRNSDQLSLLPGVPVVLGKLPTDCLTCGTGRGQHLRMVKSRGDHLAFMCYGAVRAVASARGSWRWTRCCAIGSGDLIRLQQRHLELKIATEFSLFPPEFTNPISVAQPLNFAHYFHEYPSTWLTAGTRSF